MTTDILTTTMAVLFIAPLTVLLFILPIKFAVDAVVASLRAVETL